MALFYSGGILVCGILVVTIQYGHKLWAFLWLWYFFPFSYFGNWANYWRKFKMKALEILGTLLAASGFLLLSFGLLFQGFILGLFSCFCLLPVMKNKQLYYMLGLQLFFLLVNINGIFNNLV